jgi:Domain of unknown function (DUF4219)/gag-polypeptide of LTR copia-type
MVGFGNNSFGMTVPKLTKSNYDNWSIQIRALLEAHDVWDIVETWYIALKVDIALTTPHMMVLKEKKIMNKMTLYIIYQGVDEIGPEKIAGATFAKETWGMLLKTYKGADQVKQIRLQTLRGEFEMLKMNIIEGVSDYIIRVQTMSNQLKRNKENLSE